jgi:hypothetical protein
MWEIFFVKVTTTTESLDKKIEIVERKPFHVKVVNTTMFWAD